MLGAVPEEKEETRATIRYETVIATFIALLAVCVAGYTAYMQRQQVRAAVWPILEFDSSNGPIRFTLANKGVGPAIIKHVILKVDDQPVKNWAEVLEKILGPGYHPGEESDMSGRVFAAGESMNVFTPHDEAQNPIPFDKSNPLWAKLDAGRSRVTVEICYCSTLGECWTLRAGGLTPRHDYRDPSLPDSVGDHISAVVSRLSPSRSLLKGDRGATPRPPFWLQP
jgi:hypothetical protein